MANLAGRSPKPARLLAVVLPFQVRGLVVAAAVALGMAGLATTPVSPLALGRADAALGRGDAELAAARYDAIASWSPLRSTRQLALRRAATVWSVELGDRGAARTRLERLARSGLDGAVLAEIREEIANLLVDERQLAEAARLYQAAWEADPASPDAPDRLIRAAHALDESGDRAAADAVWDLVAAAWPAHRSRAELGRAESCLAAGDVQGALGRYRAAVHHAEDPQLAAVAQLGVATCLERLGDLDEAMAAIDAADLPEDVRASRSRSLSTRERSGRNGE